MKNSDFGRYVERKRLEKGFKSQRKFAEKAGISSATLSRIENNIQVPTPDTLKILSEHLDVGYADLMEKAEYFKGLSSDQKEYMKNFFLMHYELDHKLHYLINQLDGDRDKKEISVITKTLEDILGVSIESSPEGLKKALQKEDPDIDTKNMVLEALLNVPANKARFTTNESAPMVAEDTPTAYGAVPYNPTTMVRTPVLGCIAAGQPINRIEHIEGYEYVAPELLRGREAFCLRVQGDSMSGDHIYDGDVVIVVVQNEVTSSDIAVVAVNGDYATLKRVKCKDDMCMLIPSNPQMEPILVEAGEVKVIGKVIEVRRKL